MKDELEKILKSSGNDSKQTDLVKIL